MPIITNITNPVIEDLRVKEAELLKALEGVRAKIKAEELSMKEELVKEACNRLEDLREVGIYSVWVPDWNNDEELEVSIEDFIRSLRLQVQKII